MRSGFRILLLSGLCVAIAASGAPAGTTSDVRRLVAEVKYEEARRLLENLQALEGQPLEVTLELLELQGVIAGALKQPDRARTAFRKLLMLRPGARLSADYAPRITTPFFEAKGWLSSRSPMAFARGAATLEAGAVTKLAVTLQHDSLNLARKLRLFVRQADQSVLTFDHPASAEVVQPIAGAETVWWWAQVLGERDAVIAQVGSRDQPLSDTAKSDLPLEPHLDPSVAVRAGLQPELRITGYVAASVGAVAIAVGAVFGVGSAQARASFERATSGVTVVTTLTRAQAMQLNSEARTKALVANIFFVTGATLLITGVVLWLLGAPPSQPAAAEPTP